MVSVTLRDLSRVFKDGTRVGPVNLQVNDGELLTLLGPSGSGKTTTLRMIAGFIEIASGQLLFNSKDVAHIPPRERGIGMVFQSIALFPNMTVYSNIAFGPEMAGWSRAATIRRVEELADILGIRELLHRRTKEISGGEGQRVALARAIALRPQLLLLDEPLSALDPQLRERLQMEIRDIQRKLGITTIYVTHSQDEAFAISDRIAVLKDGEIVQVGTPQELYDRPRTRFVAEFIGGGNIIFGITSESGIVAFNTNIDIDLSIEPGSEIMFTVKPEDIIIFEKEVHESIEASIISITPQVGDYRILIDIDGKSITAICTDEDVIKKMSNQSKIWVKFRKESIVILPAD